MLFPTFSFTEESLRASKDALEGTLLSPTIHVQDPNGGTENHDLLKRIHGTIVRTFTYMNGLLIFMVSVGI